MTTATVLSFPEHDDRVKCLRAELVDVICEPAYEALSRSRADRIRERAALLVERGHAVVAEALVADEIKLAALGVEIAQHLVDCAFCSEPGNYWSGRCIEVVRLEQRERNLLTLVANAGGLRCGR